MHKLFLLRPAEDHRAENAERVSDCIAGVFLALRLLTLPLVRTWHRFMMYSSFGTGSTRSIYVTVSSNLVTS